MRKRERALSAVMYLVVSCPFRGPTRITDWVPALALHHTQLSDRGHHVPVLPASHHKTHAAQPGKDSAASASTAASIRMAALAEIYPIDQFRGAAKAPAAQPSLSMDHPPPSSPTPILESCASPHCQGGISQYLSLPIVVSRCFSLMRGGMGNIEVMACTCMHISMFGYPARIHPRTCPRAPCGGRQADCRPGRSKRGCRSLCSVVVDTNMADGRPGRGSCVQ